MTNELYPSQMLLVGAMLNGRYRIERYLASGGFGNTYVAVDTRFDSRVAVKEFFMRGVNHRSEDHSTVVVSNAANQEGFDAQLNKFRREAQRISAMCHSHIVHVRDLFDDNDTSYYVMDLIEGESLKERVMRHPLTEAEVRDVAAQLLDALADVHKAGFYHLDVKPGNIMIDSRGHCTLIDFGASKQMSTMDRTSMSASGMAYTPGYAPLEQEGQRTKSIGPWTDFYAVGATLYNLLTGHIPPEIAPDDTTDDSRMFDYPKGVTSTMQRAISCMMNPLPSKRPQNVEQMKNVLEGMPLRIIDVSGGNKTVSSPSIRGGAIPPPLDERRKIVEWVEKKNSSQEKQIRRGKKMGGYGGTSPVNGGKPSTNNKIFSIVIALLVVCIVVFVYVLLRSSNPAQSTPSFVQKENSQNDAKTASETEEEEPSIDSFDSITISDETMENDPFIDPDIDRVYNVAGVPFMMVAIEGSTFTMGATSEQVNPAYDENPGHKVSLSGFSIGETEVTQALWKAVMGNNPSFFKGDNLPVESVSWADCQDFISKLNVATEGQRPKGREFRLPTEAEWEFAARGGNVSNHTQYAGSNKQYSVAWFKDNSEGMTHPVAQKMANELKLFDMSGNVWEWCQDWYNVSYYNISPATNPCNNKRASRRVARGGCWGGSTRVAFRGSEEPTRHGNVIGLRLAI